MTITIGAWILPAAITLLGWLPLAFRQSGDYDFGGAFIGVAWIIASVVAWMVYGLTVLAA